MTILFANEANLKLAKKIAVKNNWQLGDYSVHTFPDSESLVKLKTEVKAKDTVILESLNSVNQKFLDLIFLAETLRDSGANKVNLIAPYLSYMRQDSSFNPGEAKSAKIFAKLISNTFDSLVTIDPHLHRYKNLNEIYHIPTKVLSAVDLVAEWLAKNVENPVLIGPDSESKQWVTSVAKKINAPSLVLNKTRISDTEVKIEIPDLSQHQNLQPVLVDDIISTANTMLKAAEHLFNSKMLAPICICVHPIFAANAYAKLQQAKVSKIISCNTIEHPSNAIDISSLDFNL